MCKDSDNLGNHNPADDSRNTESDKFGCHFVAPCLGGCRHGTLIVKYIFKKARKKERKSFGPITCLARRASYVR